MKVIGVGFGRTGTTSIQRALEKLGYHAYNFEAVLQNEHFDAWREAAEGKNPDWQKIFSGYDASISWPACFFYKELYEAYPDAKFILTTRDPERWAESVSRGMKHFPKLRAFRFIPRVRAMLRLMDTLLVPKLGSLEPDKEHLMGVLTEHNRAVRAFFPPEQLLIYEVKDGWEPLCNFLDKSVPSAPFPFENQGDDFIKQTLGRFVRGETSQTR